MSESAPLQDLRRQSCFSLSLLQGAEAEEEARSPCTRREAACEALRLISCLNNPIKVRLRIFSIYEAGRMGQVNG